MTSRMCVRGRHSAGLWLGGVLLAVLLAPGRAPGQTAESAFLFAYRPKPGMEADFEDGYRAHLAWHHEAGDPFVWYGWNVVTGDELGVFVDGTFGPTPAEFDDRVSPAADAAHFGETTAPFADALWRKVYRSRPDLGTSRFLEERAPSAALRVMHYRLEPDGADEFAAFLGRVAATRAADSSEAPAAGDAWAAYELVDGGTGPEFMLLLPAEGLAGLEFGGPVAWLAGQADGAAGSGERARLGIRTASSVTWRLREDLTYIPEP